jgi:dipeptide/tripeptide permease
MTTPPTERFPKVFWTANVTELFERAAYYSMASFVVIYLGQLGFGIYWPSNLNSVLWTLVYFLPILSGTIADQVGFRRSLLVAFVLLAAGYFLMGFPVWFGGGVLAPTVGKEFTARPGFVAVVVVAILLIGMGGSVIKPCISGTVQKTSGTMATLGFAIFYMVINIGSLFGRATAYVVRTRSSVVPVVLVVATCAVAATALILLARWSATNRERRGALALTTFGSVAAVGLAFLAISWVLRLPAERASAGDGSSLSSIFAVATAASIVAFVVVLLFYEEPVAGAAPAKPRRSVGRILLDMVLVLRSGRFTLFLLVISGFFFLYNQVYNVLPLYVKRVVETSPAMDIYTAANPLVIVCFQLLISRGFGTMRPIRSMIVGSVGISLSMALNLVPVFAGGGVRAMAGSWLPLGSVFVVLTVATIAFSELFTSPRMYEYIGSLAPKGQEGLFLGYANLPLAIGSLLGGPVGAFIFNDVMAKGATVRPDGLLDLDPTRNALGWGILMGIGLASAASMWLFNRWLERQEA